MATSDAFDCKVYSQSSEISSRFQVLSVAISRVINRIPSAQLLLRDGDPASSKFASSDRPDFNYGAEIRIDAGYGGRLETIFKGILVRQGVRVRRGRSPVLVVDCRDQALKLSVGRSSAIWHDDSDANAIASLAKKHGIETEIDPSDGKHVQLVQGHANDWDFVKARAAANGFVVIPEDGKLVVTKPSSNGKPVATITYGSNLFEIDTETDAREQFAGVAASAWSPKDQELLSKDLTDVDFQPPGNGEPAELASVASDLHLQLRHAGNLTESELEAWAGGELLFERMSLVRGRARCQGIAAIRPGAMVTLAGVGERFSGNVYVSGVRHEISKTSWETDFQFGFPRDVHGDCAEKAGFSGLQGLQIGVVTKLEGDPDHEERVGVRVPLLAPATETVWARLASLDAGAGDKKDGEAQARGFVCRPEVGDEVVMGFLQADPRFPVVLGMLHSSKKPAPLPASEGNESKGFVTRSGAKLLFNDKTKSITLETPAGNQVVISDKEKGICLQDEHGNKIFFDKEGVHVESKSDLTLKARGTLSLQGDKVSVQAAKEATLEGSQLTLKATLQSGAGASSGLELTSNGTANLHAAMRVDIN